MPFSTKLAGPVARGSKGIQPVVQVATEYSDREVEHVVRKWVERGGLKLNGSLVLVRTRYQMKGNKEVGGPRWMTLNKQV